jgi:hypothetical protein
MRGFSGRWMDWIDNVLNRWSVGLTINNEEREFFHTRGPLSPLLFNLDVDVLSRMLQKAAEAGLI